MELVVKVYICNECSHVSLSDTQHRNPNNPSPYADEFLWCEGEVSEYGASAYDEDNMEALQDYMESRVQNRAQLIAEKIIYDATNVPTTLEEAAAATANSFDPAKKAFNESIKKYYNDALTQQMNPIQSKVGKMYFDKQAQVEYKGEIMTLQEYEQRQDAMMRNYKK